MEVQLCPIKMFYLDAPLCVTQKKFVLIANPLSVPIIVHSKIEGDGVVGPLALNPNHNIIPLQLNPVLPHDDNASLAQDVIGSTSSSDSVNSEIVDVQLLEDDSYSNSYWENDDSDVEVTMSISSVFQPFVQDMKDISNDFLKFIREEKIQTKSEADVKLLTRAIEMLLEKPYFKDLRDQQMYLNLNWERLPENPKEVIIKEEPFYLKPFESTVFPVLVVPNTVGSVKKHVAFTCSTVGTTTEENVSTMIDVEHFTTRLEINYFGIYPHLLVPGCIFLGDIYVDMINPFDIVVRNDTRIVGFVYLRDIVSILGFLKIEDGDISFQPDDEVSSITIYSERKLVLPPGRDLNLEFGIKFSQVGKMRSKAL